MPRLWPKDSKADGFDCFITTEAGTPAGNAQAPATVPTLKAGAKVKVKNTATKYSTGQTIPNWVKGNTYTVQQIGNGRILLKGNCELGKYKRRRSRRIRRMNMDTELLNTIMTAVVLPLLVALSGYLVAYLRKKAAEATANIENQTIRFYIEEANEIVLQAVEMLFQTYVDDLKKKGQFTKEAQLEAFNRAKDITLQLLTAEAREILIEIYGDLDLWIKTKIEQAVKQDKDLKRLL